MEVIKFTAEITHQYSEKFRAAFRFNYNHYEPQVQSFAWQLPRYDANLNLTYNIGDKLLLSFDGFILGDRKVLIFNNQTENIQTIKPLGDFNLGIDYRYKKQISAFVKLNNLMGQHYQIWYAHPMYSFNMHAGLAIGF
jgi:hypothetical protein